MDIIVFVDELGTANNGERDFREIEICPTDEPALINIVSHATGTGHKLQRVWVLTAGEYSGLKAKASSWDDYQGWKRAKAIYEAGKTIYEVE